MARPSVVVSTEAGASLQALPQRGAVPRAVVDALPMPVLVSRIDDDTIVVASEEFAAVYGYAPDAVVGVPAADLHFVSDDRRATLEAHTRGGLDSVEVRMRASDGRCLWAQADIARFELDGVEDVLLTTFYDITAQKAAEQELAERARFPAMNPGAVARLAADGTVIRANPAATSLFGHDDIRGMSWLQLCPGIDAEIWARARGDRGLVQYEADIGERCHSFTLRHEPTADQVFVYGSDITELKHAERALAELARFPDMNPGPVCRLDRSGQVLLANPAARAVFGVEDLAGESWFDLVPDSAGEFWEALLASGETVALDTKIGDREYLLTHAPGSEGLFVFVYGSDITWEREAEQALRQSEKMATLGTLAAGVAHELNNPASAAQRAAEQLDADARRAASCGCELDALARSDLETEIEEWLLGRGADAPWEIASALVDGGLDLDHMRALEEQVGPEHVALVAAWHAHAQQVYRLLDEIRQGTARLVEIVGAMKAYSYLGQAPLQNVDVNEGLRSTLVILRSKLKGGIVVHQELAPDLPRIAAYGSELNQVWTNLLDNAADAMEGRGEIRLRSRLDGDHVVVDVEDDGPGIPEDVQSRVFDAFFTTKPPGKGTGLGLNTTYKIIVEKHRGRVRLESVPGRTRFTVELPLGGVDATSDGGAEAVSIREEP